MTRGTTPIHRFRLPFDTGGVTRAKVLYAQDGQVVLEKDMEQLQLQGREILVRLSQEDTMVFDSACKAEIQLRLLTTEGTALASRILTCGVGRLLKDEVLA